ncbi:MAG: SPOR domain-containing protein, partial [Gammaproteobacteria bacterium]|nr:SPOR domain-containing protein [Gammaproteobacteria bacterium]
MTRDYKKPMRSSKKKPLPGWVWLITGLAIGLFVSVLMWLKDLPDSGAASVVEQSREEIRTRTQQVEEVEEEKPRFDFYTLLPELEVVIPEGDYVVEPARQPKESPTSKPVAEEPGSYRLQAGSFKSLDEADRLKARLALLGVEASIQTVKVNKA